MIYYIILYYIILYHIISYHIISYHIISYHIISYHIISYHIISYHHISYHISHIIYHIISYHFIYHISYHIISYNISYHLQHTFKENLPENGYSRWVKHVAGYDDSNVINIHICINICLLFLVRNHQCMVTNRLKVYTTFLQDLIYNRIEVYCSLLTNPQQQRCHSPFLPYLPETHKKTHKLYHAEGQQSVP
jgi:hypothetical protein